MKDLKQYLTENKNLLKNISDSSELPNIKVKDFNGVGSVNTGYSGDYFEVTVYSDKFRYLIHVDADKGGVVNVVKVPNTRGGREFYPTDQYWYDKDPEKCFELYREAVKNIH